MGVAMFNTNIKVERPAGTKIYHRRDCKYVYYVTGSEYKKGKKYVVEKRVCIGKMIDDTQCTHIVDRAKEYGYKHVRILRLWLQSFVIDSQESITFTAY